MMRTRKASFLELMGMGLVYRKASGVWVCCGKYGFPQPGIGSTRKEAFRRMVRRWNRDVRNAGAGRRTAKGWK